MTDPDALLTRMQVALMVFRSYATIGRWRRKRLHQGSPYTGFPVPAKKVHGRPFWRAGDIEDWLKRRQQ